MTIRALCIHGHFYQPPREVPLTAEIPHEEGAAPFPNWNERIYDHCYAPNVHLKNFERLSFNVGPTLWNWMFEQHADTCAEIVKQEHVDWKRYGVSNAMAQPYNHSILPLANKEDKLTQIRWGIEDFEFRYGHRPQGMWLPETAVDLETLETLVECGIEYTILAPWQAEELPDTNRPYLLAIEGNRKLSAFFYNQDLSTRVSFDPTSTVNADEFLQNAILPQFKSGKDADGAPQLVTLASDGELYGHHQPFRDKFLQHLLNGALKRERHHLDLSGTVAERASGKREGDHQGTDLLELPPWRGTLGRALWLYAAWQMETWSAERLGCIGAAVGSLVFR